MPDRIEASNDTKKAWPSYAEMIDNAAHQMASDFIDMGQSSSEAGSLVAHALLRAAWKVAGSGRIADGFDPNPDAFIDAAKRATSAIEWRTAVPSEEST